MAIIFLSLLNPVNVNAQENDYDEILVLAHIEKVGSIKLPAIIYKEQAYLSVKDLFEFLKLKISASPSSDTLTGFFINPGASFLIDKSHIFYQNKNTRLAQDDVFITETSFYLKSSWISQVFGLVCTFDFNSVAVNITTKIELPAIREQQAELMRKNIVRLQGQTVADTTITRKMYANGFGIADWSIISRQQTKQKTQTRIDLALAGLIAGGEAKALLNYNSGQPFSNKNQFYTWKYVNNKSAIVKQFVGGTVFTQATTTLRSPVVGVQFTNAPTTYRKAFGTYRLNSKTEPDWMVELYVNNVLVNYTKADASGFFNFDVPLVYGTLVVKLKFYGPWGQEQVREENISIPYNFIPAKQFEYMHTSGMAEIGTKSIFSRTAFNYGINNHVTVGGGVEYLSALTTGKAMPFLNGSFRILSNILLTGNYTHGVKASGLLSYRLPSNLQFDLEYSKYAPQQQAILTHLFRERKLSVSLPVRGKHYSAYSKLTVSQVSFFKGSGTVGEFLVSGSMAAISANITTNASIQGKVIDAYSNVSVGYRFPLGIRVQPQLRFEYSQKNISSIRVDVEKNFSNRGSFNVSYENNFITKSPSFNVGFRYDLSFVQTQFAVQRNKQGTISMQSARGSLWVDKNVKGIAYSNRSHVGKGGVLLVPFLDVNGNNKNDKGEPKLDGLKVRTNGGITVRNADSTIRITDIEAYSKFRLEFNRSSFENLAWQLTHHSIDVEIQPNHITVINLAVQIVGEVAGTVYLQKNNMKDGLGRIIIVIHNSDGVEVARVLTEPDGYFSFLGLKPGTYTASIERDQLKKLKMKTATDSVLFSIKKNKDGDVADGLEFLLFSSGN